MTDDRTFPAALTAVSRVAFDYDHGRGIDYEPYGAFLSAEETTEWFRAWTGNDEVDGDAFRMFGQQGAGGLVALWLVRKGRPLAEQPVVYLGSEGETVHLARDLADFLWLLAQGVGPTDVAHGDGVGDEDRRARPDAAMTTVAERFAAGRRREPQAILRDAAEGIPDLEDTVLALCG
ncbi:SMI1/KNR4 family protein [Streptomyces sp. NPDC056600]|uniref:SMI1/KNR4 family protein n=1 Tax=Streptomyces sp. NPDC056600 TaxID=3345874 RepID=UPI00367E1887